MCPRVRYHGFYLYSPCSSESGEIHLTSTDSHSIHIVYIFTENLKLFVCNFDATFLHRMKYKIKRGSALKCIRLTLISCL